MDALRGVEGAAAARYFQAFDVMVQPPFRFERRSKHPAHNSVNALLNLGYTLLTGEIAGKLEHAGFDPRVGYYHGVRCGRSSLALDVIEPHRADVIDRLTLSILNRRMLGVDDFEDKREHGIRLAPDALRRYLSLYEHAMGEASAEGNSPRARIRQSVEALRRAVMAGHAKESTVETNLTINAQGFEGGT
ncbi:MAG: CRISPR-associated endonuclease Cas1 [Polyangiaceae bacterium]|nr:CRISPR-associated endonuclease Cas1 [Polyangiaceae bacterium]